MKRTGMLMMNILISVNRSYFEQAKTMLHSLRRHNQEDITVYLLNRSLDPIAVNKFESYLRKHLRIHLEIIDISATAFEQLPLVDARFSIEIYYRLFYTMTIKNLPFSPTGKTFTSFTFFSKFLLCVFCRLRAFVIS